MTRTSPFRTRFTGPAQMLKMTATYKRDRELRYITWTFPAPMAHYRRSKTFQRLYTPLRRDLGYTTPDNWRLTNIDTALMRHMPVVHMLTTRVTEAKW